MVAAVDIAEDAGVLDGSCQLIAGEEVINAPADVPLAHQGRDLVERRSKAFVVATFLAVLEMARQRLVTLALGSSSVEFYVMRPDAAEA